MLVIGVQQLPTLATFGCIGVIAVFTKDLDVFMSDRKVSNSSSFRIVAYDGHS